MSWHFYEATAAVGATALETISIENLASETANPALFLDKYTFCVSQLQFNQQQAIRWASRTVEVETFVSRALTFRDQMSRNPR